MNVATLNDREIRNILNVALSIVPGMEAVVLGKLGKLEIFNVEAQSPRE